MGALEDPRHLLPHALERPPDGRLGRAGDLELGHEPAGALNVGIDAVAVVAAQDEGKLDVGHDWQRIVGQRGQRRRDLLHDRVFSGG